MSDATLSRRLAEYVPPRATTPNADLPATTCANCEAVLSGAFCAACGQRATSGRLTLHAVAAEFLAQVIQLDHGILHTFVELVRRPGATIRGYFNGRRRSYTGPVTYATLAAALGMLLHDLTPAYHAARAALLQPSAGPVLQTSKKLAAMASVQQAMSTNRLVLVAALIPPTVLVMRFLFRKHNINLAEAGVFMCYAFGTGVLINAVASLPLVFAANAKGEIALSFTIMTAYFVYAAFGVFGRSFSTAWRMVATFVLGAFLMGAAILIGVSIVVR